MIKFIKKILFGAPEVVPTPAPVQEPVAKATEFVVSNAVGNVPLGNGVKYIAPAKPANKKVKGISAPIKVKPVTEGKTKGGNNVVKLQPKQNNKPKAPPAPKPKNKKK